MKQVQTQVLVLLPTAEGSRTCGRTQNCKILDLRSERRKACTNMKLGLLLPLVVHLVLTYLTPASLNILTFSYKLYNEDEKFQ